jgi:hypothetical protein
VQLNFADGSIGAIHYFANGAKAFPKERLQVFAQGGILQLDDCRVLRVFGWPGVKTGRLWRQDKGQKAGARAFVDAVKTGAGWVVPFDEIVEVSRISIELAERARGNA